MLQRALKVLAYVGSSRGLLRIVGLIQSKIGVNLIVDAVIREVTATARSRAILFHKLCSLSSVCWFQKTMFKVASDV
jgi:hypothetical protein